MDENFWGYLYQFAGLILNWVYSTLPYHTNIGLDPLMQSLASSIVVVLFIIAGEFLSLWVMYVLFIVMLFMETLSLGVAVIRFVKSVVPFA